MTTNVITVDDKTIDAIEAACEQCSLSKLAQMGSLKRTMVLANGMQTMRKHLTDKLMADIAGLANTPLGYMTDRREGKDTPYSNAAIRDVIIEGMLRGASVIGNEINIIAGRCYLTKQYFERMLRDWPGLTELRVREGVPVRAGDGALVPMTATWKLNGVPDTLECEKEAGGDYRIPVRVNAQMGVDAMLGKARRKLFAKIFARVSGSSWVADQADMEPAIDVDSVAAPVVALEAPQPEEVDETARELFRGIEATLQGLENVSDVDAYESSASAVLTTDDDKMTLKEWCDNRREQIRESRGQRANGKA